MDSKLKQCPLCAGEIKAEARVCRYCGARFQITLLGYCTACHAIVEADPSHNCTRCGSALVDIHVQSELIQPESQPEPTPVSPQPSQPATRAGRSNWRRLAFAGGSILILVAILLIVESPSLLSRLSTALAPSASRQSVPAERVSIAKPGATRRPTATLRPTHTPQPSPTETSLPTATPLPLGAASNNPVGDPGMACFAMGGYGLTCLDDNGWTTYTAQNSKLPDSGVSAAAVCPNGKLLIGFNYSGGLGLWDGAGWQSLYKNRITYHVACSAQGLMAATGRESASYFDGQTWSHFDKEQLFASTKDPQALLDCSTCDLGNIAIAPDGSAWTSVKGYLLRYDGARWISIETPFTEESGHIASDEQGRIWVLGGNSLYRFAEQAWIEYPMPGKGRLIDVLVDLDGRIWMTSNEGEVLVFDGSDWLVYDANAAGQIDDSIGSLALDGQGRPWIGSSWGMSVFDGQAWIAYQMSNADLPNFTIGQIAVLGSGPQLPAPQEKEPAAIAGKIQVNVRPLTFSPVQICQYHMGMFIFFYGTPCSGKPLLFTTLTDEKGEFRIQNIPPGWYALFFNTSAEDDWEYGQGFLLEPGQELSLPDLKPDED